MNINCIQRIYWQAGHSRDFLNAQALPNKLRYEPPPNAEARSPSENISIIEVPRSVTDPTITAAMSMTMMAYSTDVTPSSREKLLRKNFI
jgi:hypothetical protein